MDGPMIFMGIVVVAVTAMVIYMFVDVTKYKEMTNAELKQNDVDLAKANTTITQESTERRANVNYIIDKANEANQNLYTRFDGDVKAVKSNLDTLNTASQRLDSVMRVSGGTTTATSGTTATTGTPTVLGGTSSGTSVNGRPITELPGSTPPNLELIGSVMATNGLTVKKTLTTDKLQLGNKFLFSGVGDAHANDDWLRVFGKDGKGYYGGIAMNKLWTGSEAHLGGNTNVRGNLNIRGGSSEHNAQKWDTHLPWNGDNKNYIRGDTEIRGNTNNIGDLNVGRNANVQGRLHFSDPTYNKSGSAANTTDSYYLEKKGANNASHLRLTINDDNDESLQIWGGACAAGNCAGEGQMKHKFDALGNIEHAGTLKTNGGGVSRVAGPLKVRHGHGAWTDNASISTQAVNGQVGASFAGQEYWSHFPWADQHTYIRPGRGDRSVIIGDIGQNVHIGRNDGGGVTQVRSHWLKTRRHIDADIDWGGKGTTLFTGWVTDKTVIGNHKTGGHDVALNAPKDTIIATNPVVVHGDVKASRVCTGNVCLRGEGNNLVIESSDKSKKMAMFSPDWDKVQIYTNANGVPPYFYVNGDKNFGVWSG